MPGSIDALVTHQDPYTPALFEHQLPAELFTSERLDEMCKQADKRGTLKVQFADPGRQRFGNDPVYTRPSYPIIEDVMQRPLQYRLTGVDEFAGDGYRECLEHVFEIAGPDPKLGRIYPETVVRVFTPGVHVAIHGDPDLKLVSTISGETVWWARPPETMSQDEHEKLLRGQFFLQWSDYPDTELRIPPGWGCFLPSRWPHWLTHPGEVPVVSFEVGFWTYESLNARKVYDVNWLLRRVGVDAKAPGGRRDATKRRAFDAISTVTRKGTKYRGM
jgi:hypothetical protein